MTALPGINIAADGRYSIDRLLSLVPRGSILRIVIEPKYTSQKFYLKTLKDEGFKILGVIARESLEGRSFEQLAKYLSIEYAGLIDYLQLGNEWDHQSESSWTMHPSELNALLSAFWNERKRTNGTYKLVLGGAVSGDASRLGVAHLPLVDYIAVHLYGVRPKPSWHPEGHSTWGFGSLPEKLDGYAAYGKPLMITEYGLPTQDFGPSVGASFHREMVLALTNLVYAFMPFCMGDDMVPGYGMLDVNGTMKTCGLAFRDEVARINNKEQPIVPSFVQGFEAKANQLGKSVVGEPLEDQDYIRLKNGGELAIQTTTTGVMFYSAKANKVHFIAGK
jgi:hypothetical protein